ncbi:MAG: hypothetical protein HQK53_11180, partial [Oligoflexia bacterium]|nr:hypothetical protein [Oligoflexia bacterium]
MINKKFLFIFFLFLSSIHLMGSSDTTAPVAIHNAVIASAAEDKLIQVLTSGTEGNVSASSIKRSLDKNLGHIFGDFFIDGDIRFEGNYFVQTFSMLLSILNNFNQTYSNVDISKPDSSIKKQIVDHMKGGKNGLERLIKGIQSSIDFATNVQARISRNGDNQGLRAEIFNVISRNLTNENDFTLFPGGTKNHAIVYKITLTDPIQGIYTLAVINTGDGLQFHPYKIIDGEKKYRTVLNFTQYSKDELVLILESLLSIKITNNTTYPNKIDGLYRFLSYKNFEVQEIEAASNDLFQKEQKSGTCSWSSLMALMRDQFDNLGDYKTFKFLLKKMVIDAIYKYMKDNPENPEVTNIRTVKFLRKAIEQISVQLSKDSGVRVKQSLNISDSTLNNIKREFKFEEIVEFCNQHERESAINFSTNNIKEKIQQTETAFDIPFDNLNEYFNPPVRPDVVPAEDWSNEIEALPDIDLINNIANFDKYYPFLEKLCADWKYSIHCKIYSKIFLLKIGIDELIANINASFDVVNADKNEIANNILEMARKIMTIATWSENRGAKSVDGVLAVYSAYAIIDGLANIYQGIKDKNGLFNTANYPIRYKELLEFTQTPFVAYNSLEAIRLNQLLTYFNKRNSNKPSHGSSFQQNELFLFPRKKLFTDGPQTDEIKEGDGIIVNDAEVSGYIHHHVISVEGNNGLTSINLGKRAAEEMYLYASSIPGVNPRESGGYRNDDLLTQRSPYNDIKSVEDQLPEEYLLLKKISLYAYTYLYYGEDTFNYNRFEYSLQTSRDVGVGGYTLFTNRASDYDNYKKKHFRMLFSDQRQDYKEYKYKNTNIALPVVSAVPADRNQKLTSQDRERIDIYQVLESIYENEIIPRNDIQSENKLAQITAQDRISKLQSELMTLRIYEQQQISNILNYFDTAPNKIQNDAYKNFIKISLFERDLLIKKIKSEESTIENIINFAYSLFEKFPITGQENIKEFIFASNLIAWLNEYSTIMKKGKHKLTASVISKIENEIAKLTTLLSQVTRNEVVNINKQINIFKRQFILLQSLWSDDIDDETIQKIILWYFHLKRDGIPSDFGDPYLNDELEQRYTLFMTKLLAKKRITTSLIRPILTELVPDLGNNIEGNTSFPQYSVNAGNDIYIFDFLSGEITKNGVTIIREWTDYDNDPVFKKIFKGFHFLDVERREGSEFVTQYVKNNGNDKITRNVNYIPYPNGILKLQLFPDSSEQYLYVDIVSDKGTDDLLQIRNKLPRPLLSKDFLHWYNPSIGMIITNTELEPIYQIQIYKKSGTGSQIENQIGNQGRNYEIGLYRKNPSNRQVDNLIANLMGAEDQKLFDFLLGSSADADLGLFKYEDGKYHPRYRSELAGNVLVWRDVSDQETPTPFTHGRIEFPRYQDSDLTILSFEFNASNGRWYNSFNHEYSLADHGQGTLLKQILDNNSLIRHGYDRYLAIQNENEVNAYSLIIPRKKNSDKASSPDNKFAFTIAKINQDATSSLEVGTKIDALFLAYLHLYYKDYDNTFLYLKQAENTLSAYSPEELEVGKWIIESLDENNDHDPDAAAVRIYAGIILYKNWSLYKNDLTGVDSYTEIMKFWKSTDRTSTNTSNATNTDGSFWMLMYQNLSIYAERNSKVRSNLEAGIEELINQYDYIEFIKSKEMRAIFESNSESNFILDFYSKIFTPSTMLTTARPPTQPVNIDKPLGSWALLNSKNEFFNKNPRTVIFSHGRTETIPPACRSLFKSDNVRPCLQYPANNSTPGFSLIEDYLNKDIVFLLTDNSFKKILELGYDSNRDTNNVRYLYEIIRSSKENRNKVKMLLYFIYTKTSNSLPYDESIGFLMAIIESLESGIVLPAMIQCTALGSVQETQQASAICNNLQRSVSNNTFSTTVQHWNENQMARIQQFATKIKIFFNTPIDIPDTEQYLGTSALMTRDVKEISWPTQRDANGICRDLDTLETLTATATATTTTTNAAIDRYTLDESKLHTTENYQRMFNRLGNVIPNDAFLANRIENLKTLTRDRDIGLQAALGAAATEIDWQKLSDDLGHYQSCYHSRVDVLRKSILNAANRHLRDHVIDYFKIFGRKQEELTIDDCKYLFAQGNYQEFTDKNKYLDSKYVINNLVSEIAKYLLVETLEQKVDRSKKLVDKILAANKLLLGNHSVEIEKEKEININELKMAISSKHEYEYKDFPEFLVFESY